MSKTAPLHIRKWYQFIEETLAHESGMPVDGPPLYKFIIAAAIRNPYAGRFSPELDLIIEGSREIGAEFGRRAVAAAGGRAIESYGKASIVGLSGEYEHGNAFITVVGADPVRQAIGGGKAWVPSAGKRAGPGTSIDIPMAHKDALYVRSHYDTTTVAFTDSPAADEVVIAWAFGTRGRLYPRVGGLKASEIKGLDGLY